MTQVNPCLRRLLISFSVFLVIVGGLIIIIVSLALPSPSLDDLHGDHDLESVIEGRWRSLLPLDQASDDIKNQADALQTSLHCCGVFGHGDWEDNIPNSCLCNLEEEGEAQCETVRYRNFLSNLFWQKRSVFRQSCFPLIMDSVTTNADITLGVVFTLLVLALLGLSLCSLTLCQMFNTSNTPLSVPVMFLNQPPSYQQLLDQSSE